MQESGSVFDELVKGISKDEREKMLSQVNKDFLKDNTTSVSVSSLFNGEKFNVAKDTPVLDQVAIRAEMSSLNFFLKFVLSIKALFQRKSLPEVFVDYKLKHLRHLVQMKGHYVNFDNRTIGNKLISEVYKLYTLILPIRSIHLTVWHDAELLNHIITRLLSLHKSIPSLKVKPTDFIEFNDLLQLFIETSDETPVKQSVMKAQRDYFNTIPSFVFRDTSEQLLPLYGLSLLLGYPLREMLLLMGVNESDVAQTSSGISHKTVLIDPVLPALEEMYRVLTALSVINFDKKMSEFFLREAFSVKPSEANGENINKQISDIITRMDETIIAIRGFLSRVPLLEIVSFFKKDPFYRTSEYTIKLAIKNFYIKSSSVLLSGMFSETLQSLRLAYIDNSVKTFFKDEESLVPLKNYRQTKDKPWETLGLHQFIYARAMMLAHNFFEKDYGVRLPPLRNLIIVQMIAKTPGVQAKFQEFCVNIEGLRSEIVSFDENLSPNSEQGRNFAHIQTNLGQNVNQIRLAQAFIDHKDYESNRLLISIADAFVAFSRFIKEKITNSTIESTQTQLASVYPEVDRNKPLRTLLEEFADHMATFAFMLQEILTYEKIARHGDKKGEEGKS